jgi:hypothetical protein
MRLQELLDEARRDRRRVRIRENQQQYYERNRERINQRRREGRG